MKVKVIGFNDMDIFEECINNFIKDKKVIDIKFNSVVGGKYINDRALILYEDIDKS